MSRTVSCRISVDLHEELRDRCNKLGCSINDFVAESIKFAMYGYAEFAFDPDWEKEESEKDVSCSQVKQVEPTESPKPTSVYRVKL